MAINAYDYAVHTDVAVKMFENRSLLSPYFLLQAGIIAFQQLLPIHFFTASALVVLLAIAATAALLFKTLKAESGNLAAAAILTICLLLVAPIPLLFPLDGKLYFGYLAINVYHNPTILVLKPFALLVFSFIFAKTGEDGATYRKSLTACVLATIACALAKPSYIIVVVPALLLSVFIPQLRTYLSRKAWFIFCGILLPAAVILAAQFWLTYSAEQLPGVYQGKSGIIFAPFVLISSQSSWLLVKFFLSIAFPLAVCFGYFRQAMSHTRLLFAWLTFIIGAAYFYLLAESGPRMMHGNFGWGGQITLFILFIVSTEFLCEQIRLNGLRNHTQKLIFLVCITFFILHVLSGIYFYRAQYLVGDYCI